MMKSIGRFSAWAVFSGLLCVAPYALGQSSVSNTAAAGTSVLSNVPAGFLTFVLGPSSDHRIGDRNGNSGCSSEAVGREAIGRSNGAWGGNGGCTSVPEGGTAAIYLAVAGLCCLGAMVWRSRQRTGGRETN
jgi:hypothetical protein